MNISTLYPSQCTLGESPFWHAGRGSYFWVDIEEGVLHELNRATQNLKVWNIERKVSLVIGNKNGDLVLALQGGLVIFNPNDGSMQPLVSIKGENPQIRCNDGGCDSSGRVWVGTMDVHAESGKGSLYCVDNNLTTRKMIGELTIPNGIAWSLDNERMYFIETLSREVKCYLFNKKTGEIYFEKAAITIPEEMGLPDGLTIDAEGMLWVALYGGSAITRWDPATGIMLNSIELPAPHITNCCFAGDNLDEMIVTSARENLTDEQLDQYPQSGNVFIIKSIGIKGITTYRSNH